MCEFYKQQDCRTVAAFQNENAACNLVRAWGLEPQRITPREPKGDVTLVKEKIQKYVGGVKCILSTEIQVQSDKLPVRHTFVRSQICKTSRKSTK